MKCIPTKTMLLACSISVFFGACKKDVSENHPILSSSEMNINEKFKIQGDDSRLLEEQGKFIEAIQIKDKSGKYFVNVSVSSDSKEILDNSLQNTIMELVPLYTMEKAQGNTEPASNEINEELISNNKTTYLITSTNLPLNAVGFKFQFEEEKNNNLTPRPTDYTDPVTPTGPYNQAQEWITLSNGIITSWINNNKPSNTLYVIRSYKKRWYDSWSSWGSTILGPVPYGTVDNYCLKDRNRIKVVVNVNYLNYTVSFYGSSTCP